MGCKMNKQKTNKVYIPSLVIAFILALSGAIFSTQINEISGKILLIVSNLFGWLYLLSVFIFCIFLFVIAISKYGKMTLGGSKSVAQYNILTWLCMLLATGFGVGLVFYGVAEPIFHYIQPPFDDMSPKTTEAARHAMQYSFFNWGIHQWAASAVVGLIIAYFQYNHEKRGLISSTLTTSNSRSNHLYLLDIIAILVTIVGIATSLGLGVIQISGEAQKLTGLADKDMWSIVTLGVIFFSYMISTYSGIDRGIKYLSIICMLSCITLMIYILISGPTLFIINTILLGLADYFQNFIGMSLRTSPFTENSWAGSWTIFYWAWTIAWSPFVGTFIARISRGRTIREFVFGVLFIPLLVACLWIGVMGSSALHLDFYSEAGLSELVLIDSSATIFEMYNSMPHPAILSTATLLLLFFFLVTSIDSATYVVSQISDNGSQPPAIYKRITWGILISITCWILLSFGGLHGLQSASIIAALPLTLIILLMIRNFIKKLKEDY